MSSVFSTNPSVAPNGEGPVAYVPFPRVPVAASRAFPEERL